MAILEFDQALSLVLQHASQCEKPAIEPVTVLQSLGRILAESVRADRDQPAFARSTRDGFAVCAEAFEGGATLRSVGVLKAGDRWTGPALEREQALQIMTGAPLPAGADAVAMIEFVERVGESIWNAPGRRLAPGENVVARASEAKAGQVVLDAGSLIGAAEVALAAACGRAELAVYRLPSVAIVATGDELMELGQRPLDEHIWNSNSYALAAMVQTAGGEPRRLAVARDTREDVRARIAEGRRSDLLVLSGGVSMGDYDLVEEMLAEAGAEFLFTGVRMQPGKPVVFGLLPERKGEAACFFFGLPGNPVSTQVTFQCFVEPLLRGMGGGTVEGPGFVQATLVDAVAGKPGVMRLLPARVSRDRQRPEVKLVGWQGSGDLAANARANCYAVLPPGEQGFEAGDVISILIR